MMLVIFSMIKKKRPCIFLTRLWTGRKRRTEEEEEEEEEKETAQRFRQEICIFLYLKVQTGKEILEIIFASIFYINGWVTGHL